MSCAVVFVCNFRYLDKFITTCENIIEIGGYPVSEVGQTSRALLKFSSTDVANVVSASTIDTANNVSVTVTGPLTGADIDNINTINANSTGAITASITDAAGALMALSAAEADSAANLYTLTVTGPSAQASDLLNLDGKTGLSVSADGVTTITGNAADVATAISASTIDGML